jgi:hypothetical protein
MDYKIKKEYSSLPKAEIIRFTNEFVQAFLVEKEKMIDVPIDAFRIVFKIASDLRNSNFSEKNIYQYNLFHDNFLSEHNTMATFTINFNDIAINKNTRRVKNALEFLVKHKQGWYKTKNKNGEEIQSYGGIISNPTFTKGKATFLISSYWLNLLTYMPKYNQTFYNLVFNVSNNKHMLFYLWLTTLPDYGTQTKLSTLNVKFNLNYSTARQFCKSFLKSVKTNLDKHSLLSFNYSYSSDTINISPYYVEPKEVITQETQNEIVISQKTHYWKIRHDLSLEYKKNIALVLKNDKPSIPLILAAYKSFVSQCKKDKIKASEIKGKEFMKIFQDHIISEYRKSKAYQYSKNGHPVIL